MNDLSVIVFACTSGMTLKLQPSGDGDGVPWVAELGENRASGATPALAAMALYNEFARAVEGRASAPKEGD